MAKKLKMGRASSEHPSNRTYVDIRAQMHDPKVRKFVLKLALKSRQPYQGSQKINVHIETEKSNGNYVFKALRLKL